MGWRWRKGGGGGAGGGGGGGGLLDKEDSLKRSSVLVFIWFLYPREHSVLSECFLVLFCFLCVAIFFFTSTCWICQRRGNKLHQKEEKKTRVASQGLIVFFKSASLTLLLLTPSLTAKLAVFGSPVLAKIESFDRVLPIDFLGQVQDGWPIAALFSVLSQPCRSIPSRQ